MNFKMEKETINWDELRKKVEEDEHLEANKDSINAFENIGLSLFGNMKPIMEDAFNLWPKNKGTEDVEEDIDEDNDDIDYGNEGGFLSDIDEAEEVSQEDIEKYAWNNKEKITTPMTPEEEKNIENYLLNLEEPGMHPELKDKKDSKKCKHCGQILDFYEDKCEYCLSCFDLYRKGYLECQETYKEKESVNKNNQKYIQCIHLEEDSDMYDNDEGVYIYPMSKDQDIYLCNNCNRELASKIMEQIATELFL